MAKQKYPIGKNPNSLANLKKGWKPGQSGNPKGRPPNTKYISELAREKILTPCPYAPDKTWGEYLVERWLGQAVENPTFFKELMDRLEGKVLQPVGGEDGEPIKIDCKHKIISTISRYATASGEGKDDSRSQ